MAMVVLSPNSAMVQFLCKCRLHANQLQEHYGRCTDRQAISKQNKQAQDGWIRAASSSLTSTYIRIGTPVKQLPVHRAGQRNLTLLNVRLRVARIPLVVRSFNCSNKTP